MHKELPLYIFLRNTVVLCLLFFVISFVIIERGKVERGDHSIFQGIIKNKNNIRDYNNPDYSSNNKENGEHRYSNNYNTDTITIIHRYNTKLVGNTENAKKEDQEIEL